MPERRRFLRGLLGSAGAAAVGGIVWGGFIDGKKAYPLVLRPPGALAEAAFVAQCIKCGLCAEACPYHTLIMAVPGDERPPGTPYFLPRENPCRMCPDVPCAAACPTGALDISKVSVKNRQGIASLDINLARMGIAVTDRETCVAFWGVQCDACYRACPLMDKAITVEYSRNERTGKHAMLVPLVHSGHCTGCGLCEHACVTKKASMFILPRDVAMGESSARYIKGWEGSDEQRMKDLPEDSRSVTPKSEKDPLDYLNTGEL